MPKRDWQSDWRNVARVIIPDFLEEFDREDPNAGPMNFFFELLPAFRKAIALQDDAQIIAILEFSWWCLWQEEKDLWNSAGVAFFEHLLDDKISRQAIASWIPPEVADEVKVLWVNIRQIPEEEIDLLFSQRTANLHVGIRKPDVITLEVLG